MSASTGRPVYQPPQSYYLALGNSITYGFQPNKAKTASGVNYGCPGESTVTFIRGGCEGLAEGMKLHDSFRGSQLKAALSFLRAHTGQVSPVILTLLRTH